MAGSQPARVQPHPYLVGPLQYGFFLQEIIVIEGFEDVGHFGHQGGVELPHQNLKGTQQSLLCLAVVHDKLSK